MRMWQIHLSNTHLLFSFIFILQDKMTTKVVYKLLKDVRVALPTLGSTGDALSLFGPKSIWAFSSNPSKNAFVFKYSMSLASPSPSISDIKNRGSDLLISSYILGGLHWKSKLNFLLAYTGACVVVGVSTFLRCVYLIFIKFKRIGLHIVLSSFATLRQF